MKKPLMLATSGVLGLVLGLAGCGDDKENGGGTTTGPTATFPTGTTEDTSTGSTTTGEDEGTTTG